MNFASFVFFSSLEYIAFVFFILVLFRFNINEYVLKFAIFSVVLSLVSNTLQTESLRAISPLVQAGLMICFVVFFLRVHLFNATVMVTTGYLINFIVSWIIATVTIHFGSIGEIEPYTRNAFIMQSASAFMMFMFGLVIYLQKGGFSFVENNSRFKRIRFFDRDNRPFLVFISLSIVAIFIVNLMFVLFKNVPNLFVSIFLFIALLGLIYLSVKRDGRKND
ncbi:hypothetical protein B1A99_28435 [Cohnella sp. CIP 111063]|nr:hypothetical protein B1A99_28435 [Cohnella sp. CIP 111063]PRX62408.1 hypothetical protein B0G52_12343 [Cohnella sp. SGD-V74]